MKENLKYSAVVPIEGFTSRNSDHPEKDSVHSKHSRLETSGEWSLDSGRLEIESCCMSFQWRRASEACDKILRVIPTESHLERGEVLGKLGWYTYRAAMQSRTPGGFRRRVKQASFALHRASESYEKCGPPGKGALFRAKALEAFFSHWLARSPAEKIGLLDKSWGLARKALRVLDVNGKSVEYVETCNQLTIGLALSIEYDSNLRSRVRKIKEAIQIGEKTVLFARGIGNKERLADSLAKASFFFNEMADECFLPKEKKELQRRAFQSWEEALKTDRTTALQEFSHPLSGHQILDPASSIELCREALAILKPQGDNFSIGRLMDILSKWTFYSARSSEKAENLALSKRLHQEALHYAEEAASRLDILGAKSPNGGVLWAHSPYAEHFQVMARFEIDPARRRLLLEKSHRSVSELVRLAKRTANARILSYAFHTSAKSELLLSEVEASKKRKKRLLQAGLSHSIQAREIARQFGPGMTWNRSATAKPIADAYMKLAEQEEDQALKTKYLQQVVLTLEEALRNAIAFTKAIEQREHGTLTEQVGRLYKYYGDVLTQLGPLAGQQENLRTAARKYIAAIEWYENVPRFDEVATCYWKLAQVYDQLQAHTLAAENFTRAARAYSQLGKRVPEIRSLTKSNEQYLLAWSKIETARTLHFRGRFDEAALAYASAATLHRSSEKWRFLAKYYSAWSKLETGESASKQGDPNDAIGAFREASFLFSESKARLTSRILTTRNADEKTMIEDLLVAQNTEYCQARSLIEEASLAAADGDHNTSFEKFGLAAEKLHEAVGSAASQTENKENAFLSTLCEAWRLSSKAEIDGSTKLFRESLVKFETAEDLSPNQDSKRLAMGHKAFTSARLYIEKFARTKKTFYRTKASVELARASNYYSECGFKTASSYATAQQLFLEALDGLERADSEKDQQRKAKRYQATCALLRESAKSFLEARQPKKAAQISELLKNATTRSKIASNLYETIKPSLGIPTNVAFYSQSHDTNQHIGLLQLEGSEIEVRLTETATQSPEEKTFELAAEITNVGREPIRIVSLDDFVPRETELLESPEKWVASDSTLNAGLRKLNSLQTETVKIKLRPRNEGLLTIRPSLTYVDSNGRQFRKTIERKVVSTSRIMGFLASSFSRDSSVKRLAIPSCGWTTLMEIANELKIPRSHVYGEPRYGRAFGKQLETLIQASLVEYRIFPGERGRGGKVTRVRVRPEDESVKEYIEELSQ